MSFNEKDSLDALYEQPVIDVLGAISYDFFAFSVKAFSPLFLEENGAKQTFNINLVPAEAEKEGLLYGTPRTTREIQEEALTRFKNRIFGEQIADLATTVPIPSEASDWESQTFWSVNTGDETNTRVIWVTERRANRHVSNNDTGLRVELTNFRPPFMPEAAPQTRQSKIRKLGQVMNRFLVMGTSRVNYRGSFPHSNYLNEKPRHLDK